MILQSFALFADFIFFFVVRSFRISSTLALINWSALLRRLLDGHQRAHYGRLMKRRTLIRF